jgi:hypothetical protein
MVQGICRIRYGGQGEEEMIVYDIEIAKAIRGRGEKKIPGIEYCGGWNDHANMGVACLCAYDYNEERYRVFMQDNITEFLELATYSDVVVGFNSYNFDNKIPMVVMVWMTWPGQTSTVIRPGMVQRHLSTSNKADMDLSSIIASVTLS